MSPSSQPGGCLCCGSGLCARRFPLAACDQGVVGGRLLRGGGGVGAASGEQLGPWAAFWVVGKRGRSPEAGLPAGADMAPQDRSHTSQTTPPRSACLCFQYFPALVALWGYISHPLQAGSVAKEGQSGGCHLTRAQARPAPRRPCCSLSVLGRPTRDRGGAGRSPWSPVSLTDCLLQPPSRP